MLVSVGASVLSMAFGACLPDGIRPGEFLADGPVGIVAVIAEDLILHYRVVASEHELRPGVAVALKAHVLDVLGAGDEVRAHVYVMAVHACDVLDGVGSGVPVVQVERCVCRMALEAYERLGSGWQFHDVYEGIVFALGLDTPGRVLGHLAWRDTLDRQAAGTMAGLAVHYWHARGGGHLRSHGACLEVAAYPVVLVAGREAVVSANIIGVQPTHKELFVFLDRHDGF